MKNTIKRAIRKLARPVWRRLGPQIYKRIDWRIDAVLGQYDVGWKRHMPAFLNAVSTVNAFGHELSRTQNEFNQTRADLTASTDDLRTSINTVNDNAIKANDNAIKALERIEFVRREIMYEMKYGTHGVQTPESAAGNPNLRSGASEPRILSPEKLAAAEESGIRLNLGCGHIPLEDYVNVDMRELPGVDVIAEAGNLPFEYGSITEIFSAHMLEHFTQEDLARRLLPHWRSLLVPGGRFRAVVPDGEAMLAGIAEGTYPFEEFREVLFGAQEYNGDFHYNLFTPASLTALLESAGFSSIEIPVNGRRNGKCFEFEASAIK